MISARMDGNADAATSPRRPRPRCSTPRSRPTPAS